VLWVSDVVSIFCYSCLLCCVRDGKEPSLMGFGFYQTQLWLDLAGFRSVLVLCSYEKLLFDCDVLCLRRYSVRFYTVSQKRIPDIIDCNLKRDYHIVIILGMNIHRWGFVSVALELFLISNGVYPTKRQDWNELSWNELNWNIQCRSAQFSSVARTVLSERTGSSVQFSSFLLLYTRRNVVFINSLI